MTELLEDTFGQKMFSHRAGKWGFDSVYAKILVEQGYRVDCSVTPHLCWQRPLGDLTRGARTDYLGFPDDAYFLDLDDISRPGDSSLLEIPVTIVSRGGAVVNVLRRAVRNHASLRGALDRYCLRWLRPNGRNREDLLRLVRQAVRRRRSYVEFVLHSSELMPGGSLVFQTARDIERLYEDMDALFQEASRMFRGATLKEYYQEFLDRAADHPHRARERDNTWARSSS